MSRRQEPAHLGHGTRRTLWENLLRAEREARRFERLDPVRAEQARREVRDLERLLY